MELATNNTGTCIEESVVGMKFYSLLSLFLFFFSFLSLFVFLSLSYAIIMEYIGIDISKDTFHVAWNDEKVDVFANSKEGIKTFEDIIHQRHQCTEVKIGLESTGIYHLLLCVVLQSHHWSIVVINPYLTSTVIKASLRHVKNDQKDAIAIRHALIAGHGYIFTETSDTLRLKALLREYTMLVQIRTKCKNMMHVQSKYQQTTQQELDSVLPQLHSTLQENIASMKKQFSTVSIATQSLLQSIPGIGKICSAALVAHIGDIQRFSTPQQLVAYIGLDCRVHTSGTSVHGKGFLTKRGNRHLRSLLFNAATVARRYNPDLCVFFEKKRAEGKHYFVAMCAVERKLVHVIYAVWKRGTPFE